MPGRKQESGLYRYGFNGKENDANGEFGSQLIQDYGFRMYNPSIGKFLSVDPLSPRFPWWTPYQFAGNGPIRFIDLDGLETDDHGSNFGWDIDFWGMVQETFIDYLFGPGNAPQNLNPVEEGDEEKRLENLRRAKNSGKVTGEGLQRVADSQMLAGEVVAGFTPFGWAVDVKDLKEAAEAGDGWGIVIAGVGFIPGGDILKHARKFDNVIIKSSDDVVEVYGRTENGAEVFLQRKKLSDLTPPLTPLRVYKKSVRNVKEFFNETILGEALKKVGVKTGKYSGGQEIYKASAKSSEFGIKKGDYFYLDDLHFDHIEVFNKSGKAKKVLNLDGTENAKKTKTAIDQKRTIDIK